ncbi:MAG: amidohydrolase family protein [Candidatus Acidiferrales bacterium]
MISRREVLKGALKSAAIAGGAAIFRPATSTFAIASQPKTPVNFAVPPNACDCHTHIFDPAHFPYAASRTYTPEAASVAELLAMHKKLHLDRVVIVQPSVYGTNNACTLDALKQIGASARGVAVIDDKTAGADLDAMQAAGIRGLRINFEAGGSPNAEAARKQFAAMVARAQARKWHVQIYTRLSVIESLKDQVMASPVPVVFDHFGGAQAALGTVQPGFSTLLSLVKSGKAYVKISGAYRSSTLAPDYADVAPLAKELIAANSERILWGTDWPHPDSSPKLARATVDVAPLFKIDDGHLLNLFATWAPHTATRQTILVDNPAKLYGF